MLAQRNQRIAETLRGLHCEPSEFGIVREGVLRRVVGLTLEATGCRIPLGSPAHIEGNGGEWINAEVVGFASDRTFLMPSEELHGVLPGARVLPLSNSIHLSQLILRSQLHVFGRCGHWTQIEHAARFAQQVSNFLAEADAV